MAQTSVEWLVEQLEESGIPLMKDELEMIEQANEMHKTDCIRFSIEWENRRDDEDIKSKEDLYDLIYKKQ